MYVLEELRAELKRIQVDGSKTLLKECFEELEEAKLVNDSHYFSRYNRKKEYCTRSTASISRLIEMKSTNEKIAALIHCSDQHIADIRLGRINPLKTELAEICIALNLYEHTVRKLFDAFEYVYDIDKFRNDLYLHIIIKTKASTEDKLSMFRNLLS